MLEITIHIFEKKNKPTTYHLGTGNKIWFAGRLE